MRVTVVGAGIIGLVSALRLAEAGHRVRIVTAAPPDRTTSAIAAALWYPYRAFPEEQVTRWGAMSLRELSALDGSAGVRVRWGSELLREVTPDPWWRAAVPELRRIPPDGLPWGYADGWRLPVPVIDMSVHLPWLESELDRLGVPMALEHVADLSTLDGDAVVDCRGLGADDPQLTPVRGQVIVVEQCGVQEWLLDQSASLTYIVPRERTVVLGGTAQAGSADLAPDPLQANEILARCAALVPQVATARILAHKVGLRPARPTIRLERSSLPDGRPLVHHYGHGGAGVTLAYGCARDVVTLLDAFA